jgi:glycine/D-amino acid oxidase-like deaminating enzyme
MAVIHAISLDELTSNRSKKQPSSRTLRTQALEREAEEVVQAIQERGGAVIDFSQEDGNPERYLSGLRSALHRGGHRDIILQKKRGAPQATARRMQEEDKARLEKRRQTGARLGQVAKARAMERRLARGGR